MLKHIIIRLIVYYAIWILFLGGTFRLFPQILYHVDKERERIIVGKELDFESDVPTPLRNIEEGVFILVDPAHTIPIVVALVLAFGVTLPITWVYRWTRPRKQYNQSFAHTLLVIPIAIALVVFLVKGSLALAFSLAGIVAAVRFRTSLEQPMDSVYMLMVIGVGLAAGTQLTTVAYLASLIFVAISLGVWKSNFGALPAELSGWKIQSIGKVGNPAERGAADTENPYNAQVEVYTKRVDAAQKAAAITLESNTKAWQIADVIKNPDGTAIIVFDIQLKKSFTLSSFIRDIEAGGKGCIDDVKMKA